METITLTFGDCGENHVGMQKIGKNAEKGISVTRLKELQTEFEDKKWACEFIDLSCEGNHTHEDAGILVVKGGIDCFGIDSRELFEEQKNLDWDKKCYMYGRVVNKHARHNLCFGENSQEPDYEQKKGRIVSFSDLPMTGNLHAKLVDMIGHPLIGEGNRYYDVRKTGIGFHGDTERKIVIGCRLGADFPLCFQWYENGKPFGETCIITLSHGDIYIMSEKAVGFDWKRKKIPTLRHSAGCAKFTSVKQKK